MVFKYKKKVYQQTLLNLRSLGGRFIDNSFSYVKRRHDSDTIKGQHWSDKNSEEGQASE
jgi:hypothetical protein